MDKNHKKLLIISILLLAISFTLIPINLDKVRTDSGYDSSYDSGGSSNSGGWSSGNDYDYDSDRSGSSYSSKEDRTYICYEETETYDGTTVEKPYECDYDEYVELYGEPEEDENNSIGFIIFLSIIITYILSFGIYDLLKRKHNKPQKQPIKKLTDQEREIFNQITNNTQELSFLNDRYNDYVQIQEAWMNFDYDKLRTKLTDELYNQYEMQLETMKVKNQKNVMTGFEFKEGKITGVYQENKEDKIEIYLYVKVFDYIEENNKVVRGTNKKKMGLHYQITYTKKEKIGNNLDKCPNCGAEIKTPGTTQCEYCRATLTTQNTEWVMSKKEMLWQD